MHTRIPALPRISVLYSGLSSAAGLFSLCHDEWFTAQQNTYFQIKYYILHFAIFTPTPPYLLPPNIPPSYNHNIIPCLLPVDTPGVSEAPLWVSGLFYGPWPVPRAQDRHKPLD